MANSYWNFVTALAAGTLARAEDVNTSFTGINTGLDLIETEFNKAIQITNAPGTTDINENAAARANKLVAFNALGHIELSTTIGSYRGNHANAAGTAYYVRDVVKDAAASLGLNNLYICKTAHTSTGGLSADTANWDLLVNVASVVASEVAAAASAASAAASYDSFDDRYLGPKAAAPTLDNDGNALITGALYFDTAINKMYVRTSAPAWALATANAADVAIADAGGLITATDVENALQEIARETLYAASYAPHEAAAPNMTVIIDAGRMMVNGVLVSNVQQSGGLSPAHATLQRIDRFVIVENTGIMFGILGTPAASPVAPAIPAGHLPICQVLIPALDTIITNSQITDERVFAQIGNGVMKFTPVASAVNEWTISNGAAGNRPSAVQTGAGDVGVSIEEVILHNGAISLSTGSAEKTIAFDTGARRSYLYGNTAGDVGFYDFTNSRSVFLYNPVANTFSLGASGTSVILASPVLNGSLSGTAFINDPTFAANSAVAAASQGSTKSYVDTKFNFRGAAVYNSVAQSIPNNTQTILTFDSESYDTSAIHDNAVNTSRLTVPSGVTRIKLKALVGFAASATGGRSLVLMKGGIVHTPLGAEITVPVTSAAFIASMHFTTEELTVVAGEYFELRAFQTSGGALNTLPSITSFAMKIVE